MKFSINRKTIKAMLNFAAKSDIRYYLQGLCVTQNNRGTYIEGTDGHILGRLLIDSKPLPENQVILSTDSLLKLKGTKKQSEEILHFTIEGQSVEVISNDETMRFMACDAKFPNTDRVIPLVIKDESLKSATFNPDLLVRFVDFSADILGKRQVPSLIQRGSESALVGFGELIPDFIGVIMPMRVENGCSIPQFCFASKTIENSLAEV